MRAAACAARLSRRRRGGPRRPTRARRGTRRRATTPGAAGTAGALGNSPALVREHGGQQLALRALVAQQRGADLVRERQRLEHLLHRRAHEAVGDGEEPDREQRLALLGQRAAGEHLAHAGAVQGDRDELVRRVRDRRHRHHRRPAAHGAGAEQRQRLAHRADVARQREERRVDVAQQLQRQADVGGDDPLEVLEGGVRGAQLAERAQRGDAAGADAAVARRPAAWRRSRPGSRRSRARGSARSPRRSRRRWPRAARRAASGRR